MSQIIAFIFARGGSKGVPGKNIRPMNGKPLIAYAIETAQAIPQIEAVMVSTDDEKIAEVARQYGAHIPFIRPAELASDDSPEWLAWQHAIRTLREQGQPIDIMVSIPTIAPLRHVEDVAGCLDKLLSQGAEAAFTVTPSAHNPYFSMVTLTPQGEVHRFMEAHQVITRRQDAPTVYDITPVAYVVQADFVLSHANIYEGKVVAHVIPPERALDIDTELDFAFAEFLMQRQGQV